MENRTRLTICDGEVTDIAQSFKDAGEGILGPRYDPLGPYSLSASRNAVVVEKAELTTEAEVDEFIAALRRARNIASSLASSDRGQFNYRAKSTPSQFTTEKP